MDNYFKEQLVKKEVSGIDMAKKVGIIALALVLVVVSSALLKQFGVIAMLAIVYGAYYLLQRTNLEYEYIFTNGDLDIDVIYSKAKRKSALNIKAKDFDIVARMNDKKFEHEFTRFEKVLDFSSGKVKDNTYVAILSHEGKRTKMIFEPNEKILEGMKMYIPRKLKWSKYGQ